MLSTMDMFRMLVVYLHLIACCVAIGAILINDLGILVRLYHRQIDKRAANLQYLKQTISAMLVLLWITGLMLVTHEAVNQGWNATLSNPKLQAKVFVVALLSLNGVLLHYRILPMLSKASSLLKLAAGQRTWAILAGALSGVSWLYAAFLGVARPLAWKTPLMDLLLAYPLLILFVFFSMWAFTSWAVAKAGGSSDELFMNSLIAPSELMRRSKRAG
jgi:magnesium-transporting ATPase (P-type)